jgi:16S rRNA G966 N2-methylase RsmD
VFLDPPYHLENEYANVLTLLAVRPPELVIAQHSSRFEPGDGNAALHRTRVLKQGDNSLSFYEPVPR